MWYFFFAFHFISLVFYVVLCRSLFVPLSFFFWPLHCLSFFDLRSLIIPVVSSNLTFTMLMGSLTEKYVLSDCHKYQQDFTVGKVKLNSIGCVAQQPWIIISSISNVISFESWNKFLVFCILFQKLQINFSSCVYK